LKKQRLETMISSLYRFQGLKGNQAQALASYGFLNCMGFNNWIPACAQPHRGDDSRGELRGRHAHRNVGVLQADGVQVARELAQLRGARRAPRPVPDVVVRERPAARHSQHRLQEVRGDHHRQVPLQLDENCCCEVGRRRRLSVFFFVSLVQKEKKCDRRRAFFWPLENFEVLNKKRRRVAKQKNTKKGGESGLALGRRGNRCVGFEFGREGKRGVPASSIFLMISTLYTLLAHLRSLGSDGTFCSTSSYFTVRKKKWGKEEVGDKRKGGGESFFVRIVEKKLGSDRGGAVCGGDGSRGGVTRARIDREAITQAAQPLTREGGQQSKQPHPPPLEKTGEKCRVVC
jgi:hypothetical protein